MLTAKLPDGFPLAWPDNWQRTPPHERRRSVYKVTEDKAGRQLEKSLLLLGAADHVITTDKPTRRDGRPMASARTPDDPGVAVWWVSRDELDRAARERREPRAQVLACDQWETTRENLRAIGLAVDALRALSRAGATQILDRAVAAFEAPQLGAGRPWWATVLDLELPTSSGAISGAFKREALRRHPDQGGRAEDWHELQSAYKAALASLNGNAQQARP